jgi:hypothetical protein
VCLQIYDYPSWRCKPLQVGVESYPGIEFTGTCLLWDLQPVTKMQLAVGDEGRNPSLINLPKPRKSGYKLYFVVTNFIFQPQAVITK